MIKHLILDVDGVLTDGKFYYTADGKVMKAFGPHDKDGIKIILGLGITIDFITADKTGFNITLARIKDWGFAETSLHFVDDIDRATWISSKYDLDEVAYVADGMHDADALSKVKLGIAPISGRIEAKTAANFITNSRAGEGAVLDACLHIRRVINVSI